VNETDILRPQQKLGINFMYCTPYSAIVFCLKEIY
jgi:hypothetical protein